MRPPSVRTGHPAVAMFATLRHPNYRLYWLGQFPAVLAQNMQFVALAWLVL